MKIIKCARKEIPIQKHRQKDKETGIQIGKRQTDK